MAELWSDATFETVLAFLSSHLGLWVATNRRAILRSQKNLAHFLRSPLSHMEHSLPKKQSRQKPFSPISWGNRYNQPILIPISVSSIVFRIICPNIQLDTP